MVECKNEVLHCLGNSTVCSVRQKTTEIPNVTHAAGFFQVTQAVDGTPFSPQKVNRFVGIELDWAIAGQMASKAEHLSNVF